MNYLVKQMKQFAFGSIIAATALSSVQGFTFDRVGNGGDAVVCKDKNGKIKSVELLDLYEGINLGRVDSYIKTDGRRFDEIVEDRLKLIDRYTHSTMQENIIDFAKDLISKALQYERNGVDRYDNVRFATSILVDVPDSDHLSFPDGCQVEQVAVKRKDFYEGEIEFLFKSTTWDKMDELSKAGLILHEAIYKTFDDLKSSIPIRYFNQNILSDKFEDIDLKDFIMLWERLDSSIVSVIHRKNVREGRRVIDLERDSSYLKEYAYFPKADEFAQDYKKELRVSSTYSIDSKYKVMFKSKTIERHENIFRLKYSEKVFITRLSHSVEAMTRQFFVNTKGFHYSSEQDRFLAKLKFSMYLGGNSHYSLTYNDREVCSQSTSVSYGKHYGTKYINKEFIQCSFEVDINASEHSFNLNVKYVKSDKRIRRKFRFVEMSDIRFNAAIAGFFGVYNVSEKKEESIAETKQGILLY